MRIDHPRLWGLIVLAAAACTGDRGPQGEPGEPGTVDPALSPIDKALVAIGGEEAVADLATVRLEVEGTRYFQGEEYAPGDALPLASEYTGVLTYDADGDASRFDITRTVKAFDAMVPEQSYSEIVRGDLGHVSGEDGLFGGSSGDLASAGTAAIRKERRLLLPELILRDVARDRSLATDAGDALLDGSLHHLVQIEGAVAPITLYVDAETGRISKLTTLESDHVLRDTEITAFFADWQSTDGGLRFPRQVYLASGDDVVLAERRTAVDVNVTIDEGDLELPPDANPTYVAEDARLGDLDQHFHQAFGAIGFRLDVVQSQVDAMELAPGVWRLGGGTHNSMAIAQSSGVVIIDAPLYGARSQAILAWAAEQFPDRPVSRLIVSHFHDDHVGGVRDFVAAGVPVISGSGTEGFLERSIAAPSTLEVDPLAAHPMPLDITRVAPGEVKRLPDANHPIDIIPIANQHAIDMVYVRLPEDDLTFVADLYSPGFPPAFPIALKEAIYQSMLAHGGSGDMIVGAHGGVAPFSQLAMEAGHDPD
jgi:glyoxylase-like metal-dependent hydrolase (beta-lactamase superfamily II)